MFETCGIRMVECLKLRNELSSPWLDDDEKPMNFSEIQKKSLFVGISLDYRARNNKDCIIIMFHDGGWQLKSNEHEDAFDFLYRYIKYFTAKKYNKELDPKYKEFIILTIGGCLSTPIKPEYLMRDVETESCHQDPIQTWNSQSYQKVQNWLHHLPNSGNSKRIYLETKPTLNFPITNNRNEQKEQEFLIEGYKQIMGLSNPLQTVQGWSDHLFKTNQHRDSLVSLLVSAAYTRWKSKDKSNENDFLKVVVDHDGTLWLLDDLSNNI
jgi:hypothetical protein